MTTKNGATAVEDAPVATIKLDRIKRSILEVPIIGTHALIVHRFDEKSRRTMLEAQLSRTRTKKPIRDPHDEYERSMHRFDDGGHGFPSVAFKAAIVDAARMFDGVKMTELRAALFVHGDGHPDPLVRLDAEPTMREDTVRLGGIKNPADLRYRAEYWPWSAVLRIEFVPSLLTAESIVALVDAAGFGGIGEWRPGKSKTGSFGTFEVDET